MAELRISADQYEMVLSRSLAGRSLAGRQNRRSCTNRAYWRHVDPLRVASAISEPADPAFELINV